MPVVHAGRGCDQDGVKNFQVGGSLLESLLHLGGCNP